MVYGTVKKIANCNNVLSENPLYVMINEMIRHFEEKNERKYLELGDVDENKKVSKKYEKVWEGIKKETEAINGGEWVEYGQDFKKSSLETNDDLPMNKPIKLRLLTIDIRSPFSEGDKFYPQLFLEDAFVWVSANILQYQKIDASEEIDVNKTSASKECELCHYWLLKMLDSNLKNMFVMDVMIY